MTCRFIVSQTPAPPSYIFQDEFTVNDWWVETDVAGVGNFTAGGYVKNAFTSSGMQLNGQTKFEFSGLFDFILDFDIDTFNGSVHTINTNIGLRFAENTGKGAATGIASLFGNNADGLFWSGTWNGGVPDTWGDFTTGNHKIRVRRNADNSTTMWVWENSQWEWDGNTAGYTSPTDWDNNAYVFITQDDTDASNYITTTINSITLNAGSFVDLT